MSTDERLPRALAVLTRNGAWRTPWPRRTDASVGVVMPGGDVVEVPMALIGSEMDP